MIPYLAPTRIQDGTMMIREEFFLPDLADIQSVDYSSAWRTVSEMDSFMLNRKLCSAGLHLFFLAGEFKVVEMGWGTGAIHRGVKRILAIGSKNSLNCMEITQVRTTRFLGFPYTAICAHSFHIQKDPILQSDAQRKSQQQDRDWACG